LKNDIGAAGWVLETHEASNHGRMLFPKVTGKFAMVWGGETESVDYKKARMLVRSSSSFPTTLCWHHKMANILLYGACLFSLKTFWNGLMCEKYLPQPYTETHQPLGYLHLERPKASDMTCELLSKWTPGFSYVERL
jgi:hypothetical protein